MTISWLLILSIAAAGFALFDGISRLRGHRKKSILVIAELIVAALLLISLFYAFPAPLGTGLLAIVLEVILILLLVLRGTGRRRAPAITLVALILNTAVLLITLGWLTIPGLR